MGTVFCRNKWAQYLRENNLGIVSQGFWGTVTQGQNNSDIILVKYFLQNLKDRNMKQYFEEKWNSSFREKWGLYLEEFSNSILS